ncbi:hypothetical protein PVAG01_05627 [Phlyctema vagabunda]|uniref:Uncharacterized protein n=1 Tax=Phlyctema vagabunda TaxID=108571 RepID=A0ABR4PKP1_9HELO
MATLLEMPVEILRVILALAVGGLEHFNLTLPTFPAATEDGVDGYITSPSFWRDDIKLARRWSRIDSIPTLLVNRWLHRETMDAIRLLPEKYCYTMDMMIVNELYMYATWLSIPAPTDQVEKVTVTVRTIDAYHALDEKTRRRNMFRGGDGGPCAFAHHIHDLLNKFFLYGPVSRANDSQFAVKALKTLELNILSPDLPEEQFVPRGTTPIHRIYKVRSESSDNKVFLVHPEYLTSLFGEFITRLLAGDTRRDFKSLLFEGVETIRLMLDGKLRQEWEVAVLLCHADAEFLAEMREIRCAKGLAVPLVKE